MPLPSLLSTPGFSAKHRKTPADFLKNLARFSIETNLMVGKDFDWALYTIHSTNLHLLRCLSSSSRIKNLYCLNFYIQTHIFICGCPWVGLFVCLFIYCFEAVPSCFPGLALNSSVQMIFLLQPVEQLTPQAHATAHSLLLS